MGKRIVETLVTEFTANTRDVDRGFAHVERRAQESVRKINSTMAGVGSGSGSGGSGGGLLSSLAEGLKILPGLGMVASGLSKIAGVMQSGVQTGFAYNRMIEESQIGFEKHFKSVDKARSHIQDLIGLRKDGIALDEALTGSKRLLAMGVAAKDVVPYLRVIADGARGANADVDALTRGLTQMIAKGAASSEEISQQIAEQGIPAWKYLADAVALVDKNFEKLTSEERISKVRKLVEQGKISGKGAAEAILIGVQKDYGGSGRRFANETATGLEEQGSGVLSQQLGTATQAGFAEYKKALKSGLDLISSEATTSAAAGIDKGVGKLLSAGKGLAEALIVGVQDGLVMHSPSQVMIGLGFQAAMSFQDGFAQGTRRGDFSAEIEKLIEDNARRTGLDPNLIRSMMKQESGGKRRAVSNKGASGLMQLMPATARGLGVTNIFDPAQNIRGGTDYMAMLMRRFGGDTRKALAGYNAGPGRVDQYGGVPPRSFAKGETYNYVRSIMADYERRGTATGASGGSWRGASAQPVKVQVVGASTWGDGDDLYTRRASSAGDEVRGLVSERDTTKTAMNATMQEAQKRLRWAESLPQGTEGERVIRERMMYGATETIAAIQRDLDDFLNGINEQITNAQGRLQDAALRMGTTDYSAASGGSFDPAAAKAVIDKLRQGAAAADRPVESTPGTLGGSVSIRSFENLPAGFESATAAARGFNDEIKQTSDIFLKNKDAANKSWIDMREGFEGVLTGSLTNWDQGFQGVISSMLQGWSSMILEMEAKAIAAQLGKKLFGEESGGGWLSKLFGIGAKAIAGGISGKGGASVAGESAGSSTGGAFAKIFGGGKASGGGVKPGYFYEVNEQGREFIAPTAPLQVMNQSQVTNRTSSSTTNRNVNLTVNFNGQNATPTDRRAMAQTARQLRDLLEHEVGRGG